MRYTMDLHMMLTKPTPTHFFDAGNRMKICRFIDKYVTRLYGTRTVSAWFTKNKGKTIFDLVTMSDIAYTVAVIENGHDKWDESKNGIDGRNLSSPRGEVSRVSTQLLAGVRRVLSSITRYGRNGRKYLEVTSLESGKKWRASGLITWKRQGWGEIKEKGRSTSQTWNTKMWIILFQTCRV